VGPRAGLIPDLPGVTACGLVEDDVIRDLSKGAQALLEKMIDKGLAPPKPSPSGCRWAITSDAIAGSCSSSARACS
jgi:hypothetical protein